MKSLRLLFFGLFLCAFVRCTPTEPSTPMQTSTEPNTPRTYLALGDSYTIGEAVAEAERWPNVLAARLTERGTPVAPPRIIARTGWTTDELQAAIREAEIGETYDLVSLLIGVNNQYRGAARGYDTATYRREFAALLEQAIGFAGGEASHVFVVSIPDYGVTPFVPDEDSQRVAQEIDMYNEINKQESERRAVPYFDITPGSRQALTDRTLIATDNLHPSGKMYAQWVAQMEQRVFEMLQ